MELMSLFFVLLAVVYSFFLLQLVSGYAKVKPFKRTGMKPQTAFTIIVPFKDEAKHLPGLLQSFSNLHYPQELIEIIMVDDFSTDASERICLQWRVQHDGIDTTLLENLRLTGSPKKDAIARAMPIAKHEWIVTTDADCRVPKNWLLTLDNYIQAEQPEMVVGAVVYQTKNNWFHQFQQLDLMSLQGVTMGSFGLGKPFMCNGANFAYTKTLFHAVDGFAGNDKIASGDDVFLLQKAVAHAPAGVHYLKNKAAIVKTKPENDLYKLFMQRVRWASKTTGYKSTYAKVLAVSVLLMNAGLVVGFVLAILGTLDWALLLGVFALKYVVDYLLLYKTNAYLRDGKWLLPLASSLVYPLFSSLVAVYSLVAPYTWKGSTYTK
jgi:cellulose synthase/poly-beta-1,6-N-acetylglucosamine synthase-like glycosyltransferase